MSAGIRPPFHHLLGWGTPGLLSAATTWGASGTSSPPSPGRVHARGMDGRARAVLGHQGAAGRACGRPGVTPGLARSPELQACASGGPGPGPHPAERVYRAYRRRARRSLRQRESGPRVRPARARALPNGKADIDEAVLAGTRSHFDLLPHIRGRHGPLGEAVAGPGAASTPRTGGSECTSATWERLGAAGYGRYEIFEFRPTRAHQCPPTTSTRGGWENG